MAKRSNKTTNANTPAVVAPAAAPAPAAKAKAAPLPLNTPAGLAQLAALRAANPASKCGAVWAWCNTQHAAGTMPSVAAYQLAYPTANRTNTQIEVGYWARANGVTLPRAPRTVSVTVAPVAVAA